MLQFNVAIQKGQYIISSVINSERFTGKSISCRTDKTQICVDTNSSFEFFSASFLCFQIYISYLIK